MIVFSPKRSRRDGSKQNSKMITVFPDGQSHGKDVPPDATMQKITIGGRPEFVDVERGRCSDAALVLWSIEGWR